jgi:hypothetical protein
MFLIGTTLQYFLQKVLNFYYNKVVLKQTFIQSNSKRNYAKQTGENNNIYLVRAKNTQ